MLPFLFRPPCFLVFDECEPVQRHLDTAVKVIPICTPAAIILCQLLIDQLYTIYSSTDPEEAPQIVFLFGVRTLFTWQRG